jgi:hypothetical protein
MAVERATKELNKNRKIVLVFNQSLNLKIICPKVVPKDHIWEYSEKMNI